MTTTTQKFSSYHQYAKNWMIENEIKLKTVSVENGNYNPLFIYINRIANGSKPQFRILKRGKDKVKNCIMITFNVERHYREYLCYLIESKMYLLRFLSHGSCHRFLNQDTIAQVLSGAVNKNGQGNPDVLK